MRTIIVRDLSPISYPIDVLTAYELKQRDCSHERIDSDVIDMGDDGDGYVCYDLFVCAVCGKEWSPSEFKAEYDYDD